MVPEPLLPFECDASVRALRALFATVSKRQELDKDTKYFAKYVCFGAKFFSVRAAFGSERSARGRHGISGEVLRRRICGAFFLRWAVCRDGAGAAAFWTAEGVFFRQEVGPLLCIFPTK
ncbi:hypothetical protein B5F90_06010 [Alistipes sp. An31A]|nr:hypothetical protein B5F90_06010 [Alistipes sp. An31A]